MMPDVGTPLISMQDVDAGYERKQVLQRLSLALPPGRIVGLVGTNGAGKSTALKVLGGSLRQWRGRVLFGERDISAQPAHRRAQLGIGYLLSGGQVFPSMSVLENLLVSRSMATSRASNVEPFSWFPELKSMSHRRAGLLSGGERQMLAISLVLLQQPKVLLLDEPTEGLAGDLGLRILGQIDAYVQQTGSSALLVEHNTSYVLKYCETIHFLSQGRILATLDPEDPDAENTLLGLYFGRDADSQPEVKTNESGYPNVSNNHS